MGVKLISQLYKGAWSSITAYTKGDIVTNDGSSYICIANNTNQEPPNEDYWGLLAQAGTTDGDVNGPASSTDNNFPLFNGATGKLLKDGGIALVDEDMMTSNSAVKVPTQQSVKAYVDLLAKSPPQGFLINGKIVTSEASNNLTVAIKTLAGNNPSSSDPVYVRIGNTVRTITSALSVTKNAGTNWFGSGSSKVATKEIDYFVYLGYNSTDGVVLGFARIPYAKTYGDFSTTTTAEKYAAISTITNATSTDEYENIGRFNAILSATASFNWSIPGTSIIINRPIFETRILDWVPSITVSGGSAPATPTSTSKYQVRGRVCFFTIRVHYSSAGSGNTSFDCDPPFVTGVGYNASEYANLVHANMSAAAGSNPGITPTSGALYGDSTALHLYANLHSSSVATVAIRALGEYHLA